jgi:CrcB protein
LIAAGGAAGALARYLVAASIQSRFPSAFPWGTFIVNISGCLVMGLVASMVLDRVSAPVSLRFFLAVGFLGAYTTFSTFELETFRAVAARDYFVGGLNIVGSVVAGYCALVAGVVLGRAL